MARIRLQDVAEHAGVSMKTVSNVVNDYPHVSPATRSQVLASIEALGYRPNATARRLATGRTGTLALAVSDVSLPYFAELASTISRLATSRGYRLLLEQTGESVEAERAVLLGGESGLVDGIIFQPSHIALDDLARYTTATPVVLLGEGDAPEGVDTVMIDNTAAAREVTEHLLRLGRRRVAFVGHEAHGLSATSRQRLTGFETALRETGAQVDPALLLAADAISAEAAERAVGDALDGGLRFDAAFCRDDLAALGALSALRRRGVRVPDDVAVTGWDDVTLTRFSNPTLTTVHPDLDHLARSAMDLLEERVGGYRGAGRHVVAPHSISVRESAPSA